MYQFLLFMIIIAISPLTDKLCAYSRCSHIPASSSGNFAAADSTLLRKKKDRRDFRTSGKAVEGIVEARERERAVKRVSG